MSEERLDQASEVAFARLQAAGDRPEKLEEPFRTVVTIYAAQGVIDNGGLRYFFENGWPGDPPYSFFSAAYRNIGATAEANAIDAAAGLFSFSDPHLDRERRDEDLAGRVGDLIEELNDKLASDVWEQLALYVQANEAAFSEGGP